MPRVLPLSDDEEAELAAFLAARPAALDLETIDGFFCALVVGTETVGPSAWMPSVLGGGALEWADEQQREHILALLVRKWTLVAEGFRVDWEQLGEERMREQLYLPAIDLSAPPGEKPLGSRWADGIGLGLKLLGAAGWARGEADHESMATVSLIAALAIGENDAGERFSHDDRKAMVANIAIGLQHLYRDLRTGLQVRSPLRAPPRVGRNDACPCGSGRKFKKCCGAPERLH